jgi:hypothetical protein
LSIFLTDIDFFRKTGSVTGTIFLIMRANYIPIVF